MTLVRSTRRPSTTASAGTASSSGLRHHHQHAAEVRDDVAQVVSALLILQDPSCPLLGHALTVDRRRDSLPHGGVRSLEARRRRFIAHHPLDGIPTIDGHVHLRRA